MLGHAQDFRVLLVIDIPFYRAGLQQLLSQIPEISLLDPVSGIEATATSARERPDLVLIDVSPAAARAWIDELMGLPQPPRIVALAVDESEESVVSWLETGISGYVSRHSSYTELVDVLRCAMRGEWTCSPTVMSFVIRRLTTLSARARPPLRCNTALTAREREILELVGRGLSNKRIALALNISHATAKNHVHHILSKLELRNRAQVAAHLNSLPLIAAESQISNSTLSPLSLRI